jgi:thiol:disulfide interchange protein DsbD
MFLDLNGNPLSEIKYGYDSNKQKFIDHLEKVKQEFAKRK